MKTLKQLREEYDSRFVPPMEISEELMLESSSPTLDMDKQGNEKVRSRNLSVNPIPSNRQMPALLIFRRMTWKTYPGKQVVALYYSKLVDKYLSIPFGPTGNLNISESRVYDTLEEMQQSLDENLLGAAGTLARAAAGNYIKNKLTGSGNNSGSGDDKKVEVKVSNGSGPKLIGGYKDGKGPQMLKKGDTFSKGVNKGDAAFQSKLKSATMKDMQAQKKSVAENKVSDLRKMVREGIETKDLQINGRTVELNRNMAKRIIEVYDSVNVINKRKIEGMLNEDVESFKKLLHFSIKQ
jgi:hypothetical protein